MICLDFSLIYLMSGDCIWLIGFGFISWFDLYKLMCSYYRSVGQYNSFLLYLTNLHFCPIYSLIVWLLFTIHLSLISLSRKLKNGSLATELKETWLCMKKIPWTRSTSGLFLDRITSAPPLTSTKKSEYPSSPSFLNFSHLLPLKTFNASPKSRLSFTIKHFKTLSRSTALQFKSYKQILHLPLANWTLAPKKSSPSSSKKLIHNPFLTKSLWKVFTKCLMHQKKKALWLPISPSGSSKNFKFQSFSYRIKHKLKMILSSFSKKMLKIKFFESLNLFTAVQRNRFTKTSCRSRLPLNKLTFKGSQANPNSNKAF
jgi:hypothetical protein